MLPSPAVPQADQTAEHSRERQHDTQPSDQLARSKPITRQLAARGMAATLGAESLHFRELCLCFNVRQTSQFHIHQIASKRACEPALHNSAHSLHSIQLGILVLRCREHLLQPPPLRLDLGHLGRPCRLGAVGLSETPNQLLNLLSALPVELILTEF